jgi:hypothetical protein
MARMHHHQALPLPQVSSQSLSQLLGVTVSAPLQISADAITAATSAAPESLQVRLITAQSLVNIYV